MIIILRASFYFYFYFYFAHSHTKTARFNIIPRIAEAAAAAPSMYIVLSADPQWILETTIR